MDNKPLTVGAKTIDREDARAHARRYLTDGKLWSYPSVRRLDLVHARGPIVDADLLAPLLLNVNRISVKTYEALTRVRPVLQHVIDRIDADLASRMPGLADLTVLGELFGVLDGAGVFGVKGTVLSKLLHRKRPLSSRCTTAR